MLKPLPNFESTNFHSHQTCATSQRLAAVCGDAPGEPLSPSSLRPRERKKNSLRNSHTFVINGGKAGDRLCNTQHGQRSGGWAPLAARPTCQNKHLCHVVRMGEAVLVQIACSGILENSRTSSKRVEQVHQTAEHGSTD